MGWEKTEFTGIFRVHGHSCGWQESAFKTSKKFWHLKKL